MNRTPNEPRSELLRAPIETGALCIARTAPVGPCRAAVVLLHGFAQNRFAFDVGGRSLPRYLAGRGYDALCVELRGHGQSRELGAPLPESFDDYLERDVPAILSRLRALGHERVFLLGHSLGGALAYAAAGATRDRIRGVVTLAGVYRWGGAGPFITALTRTVGGLASAGRIARPVPSPVVRLDLIGRALSWRLSLGGDQLPVPLQGWYPGSIEPAVLRAWIRRSLDRTGGGVLAQMADWANSGRFCARNGTVDYAASWRRSRVPALVLAADRDRLAHPRADVEPAFRESGAVERAYRCFGRQQDGAPFGHVDLLLGRRAPSIVWPVIADWLDARTEN